jgi:hypothetical protein
VRGTWEHGDVAMWDNRATQHYAVADFDTQPRITVAGEVPVSIDGQPSIVRSGNADHFSSIDHLRTARIPQLWDPNVETGTLDVSAQQMLDPDRRAPALWTSQLNKCWIGARGTQI